jgi:hypothetical protein
VHVVLRSGKLIFWNSKNRLDALYVTNTNLDMRLSVETGVLVNPITLNEYTANGIKSFFAVAL